MTLRWQSVVIDAYDAPALARFWAEVLGWRITLEDPDEIELQPPAGSPEEGLVPDLLFLPVRDEKTGKNRLHIDLRPENQDEEVRRIEALGATRISVGQGPEATWVVLADPEGNEFCVLRALRAEELAV
jgi:predicted enzyme related to lactoylglutathione lyase